MGKELNSLKRFHISVRAKLREWLGIHSSWHDIDGLWEELERLTVRMDQLCGRLRGVLGENSTIHKRGDSREEEV